MRRHSGPFRRVRRDAEGTDRPLEARFVPNARLTASVFAEELVHEKEIQGGTICTRPLARSGMLLSLYSRMNSWIHSPLSNARRLGAESFWQDLRRMCGSRRLGTLSLAGYQQPRAATRTPHHRLAKSGRCMWHRQIGELESAACCAKGLSGD